MTMTPERLAEIRELRQQTMSQVGTPTMYIIALRKGLDDLLADHDSLTAEIATLKAEVERLKRENRRRAACDLVNDQFKRSIENHEEREGRLKDELATLRTRLDALVTAGERVVSAQSCYGAEEAFTSSVDIDEAIDTLSAALAAAKGER